MLTEMVEHGQKIEETGKATQREIKKNTQGTNSEGKETRIQINDLEHKEAKKQTPRTRRRKKNPKK